jgi:hypothetical protein
MRVTTILGFAVGVVVGVIGTNVYRDGGFPLSETLDVSAPQLGGDCKMIGVTGGVRIPVYSLECFPKGPQGGDTSNPDGGAPPVTNSNTAPATPR